MSIKSTASISFIVFLFVIGAAGTLAGYTADWTGTSSLSSPSAIFGRHMSQEYVTHGVKIKMSMPFIEKGNDTALFVVNNYIPDDPAFQGTIPVDSAVVSVNGYDYDMTYDSSRNRWFLVLPRGWTLSVDSVKVTAFDANSRKIYAASASNITLW